MVDLTPSTAEKPSPEPALEADVRFMRQALALARRGLGQVSPNPPVGCLLVRDGAVVGSGYHVRYGAPHAEAVALEEAGERARGATAYVTLEPCAGDFAGKRTPACAPALIEAGVVRVVAAMRDPNPEVDGGGLRRLEAAGIGVTEGIGRGEAARLTRGFRQWIASGRPWVILKEARTRDGFVARSKSGPQWFTSEAARRWVHSLRAEVDAVLVGRRTAQVDDPALTVRAVEGRNPRRIVLDSRRSLPENLAIFSDGAAPTLRFSATGETGPAPWGEEIIVPAADAGLDLAQVLALLGQRQVTSLLVEGGPALNRAFLSEGLAQEVVIITSPAAAEADVRSDRSLAGVLSVPAGWQQIAVASEMPEELIVAQQPEAV